MNFLFEKNTINTFNKRRSGILNTFDKGRNGLLKLNEEINNRRNDIAVERKKLEDEDKSLIQLSISNDESLKPINKILGKPTE